MIERALIKVSYSMVSKKTSRPRGRPPAFDEADALDAAVMAFWRDGYEGTDLDRIAAAVGATKPSLYRRFGDKRTLFLRALARYGETVGANPLRAFGAKADPNAAAHAFLEAIVDNVTQPDGPRGCLVACVAVEAAETMDEVRDFCATVFAETIDALSARFAAEVEAGTLSARPAPARRATLLVDVMQGMAVRARVGETRETLAASIPSVVGLALGTQN